VSVKTLPCGREPNCSCYEDRRVRATPGIVTACLADEDPLVHRTAHYKLARPLLTLAYNIRWE
jgi:hypothetical protein